MALHGFISIADVWLSGVNVGLALVSVVMGRWRWALFSGCVGALVLVTGLL